MNFLKNLFKGSRPSGDSRVFMVYVRPKHCEEVLPVQIDLMNELSLQDDNSGYWVRKIARAIRCPMPAEMILYFDKNREFLQGEVENGELVGERDYEAFLAEKQQS